MFNCCGRNYLKDCIKPQNKELIRSNNKLLYEKKKKVNVKSYYKKDSDHKKKGKCYPPTDAENKNRGRHNIDKK